MIKLFCSSEENFDLRVLNTLAPDKKLCMYLLPSTEGFMPHRIKLSYSPLHAKSWGCFYLFVIRFHTEIGTGMRSTR